MAHFRMGVFLIVLFFHAVGLANPSTSISPQLKAQITKNFSKSLPSLKIDSLEATPITNLYQMTDGPVVMYVTADGNYAISGDILDLRDGKTNLTELRRRTALMQALEQLGESNMIVYAPSSSVKPKYTVTVFTDAQCSYCQKFHTQIDKINQLGIKIRYVAFPKTGKNTPAYDTLVSVWCAGDRKTAFNQAMLGTVVPLKCSSHSVDKQFHLGVLAGIVGTPTMVIEGQLIPGCLTPEMLLDYCAR